MKFKYTTLPGVPQDTKRPLVPIRFMHKSSSTLPILCLVDSGADYSYLSMEIADLLDIDLSKVIPQKSFAINGSSFLCYPAEIDIEIGGHKLNIPIHFTGQLTSAFPCIIGQENFFSKARVVFERYKWNLDIRLV